MPSKLLFQSVIDREDVIAQCAVVQVTGPCPLNQQAALPAVLRPIAQQQSGDKEQAQANHTRWKCVRQHQTEKIAHKPPDGILTEPLSPPARRPHARPSYPAVVASFIKPQSKSRHLTTGEVPDRYNPELESGVNPLVCGSPMWGACQFLNSPLRRIRQRCTGIEMGPEEMEKCRRAFCVCDLRCTRMPLEGRLSFVPLCDRDAPQFLNIPEDFEGSTTLTERNTPQKPFRRGARGARTRRRPRAIPMLPDIGAPLLF